jgi:hypothetical protein
LENKKRREIEMKKIAVTVIVLTLVFTAASLSFAATDLTTQDVEFLTKQCHIDQADVNVIPKLPEDGRELLSLLIAKRDCKRLEPFKATREYLKKYTPPPKESIMPPKGFKNDFLTQAESDYIDDINKRILDKILRDMR